MPACFPGALLNCCTGQHSVSIVGQPRQRKSVEIPSQNSKTSQNFTTCHTCSPTGSIARARSPLLCLTPVLGFLFGGASLREPVTKWPFEASAWGSCPRNGARSTSSCTFSRHAAQVPRPWHVAAFFQSSETRRQILLLMPPGTLLWAH